MASRTLKPWRVVAVALFLLVGMGATLVFFGGPQRPSGTMLAQGSSSATPPDDAPGGADGAPVASSGTLSSPADAPVAGDPVDTSGDDAVVDDEPGEMPDMSGPAPEGGVEMPLIPIPGCTCHSDDPLVVEEHLQYTLSDCMECH